MQNPQFFPPVGYPFNPQFYPNPPPPQFFTRYPNSRMALRPIPMHSRPPVQLPVQMPENSLPQNPKNNQVEKITDQFQLLLQKQHELIAKENQLVARERQLTAQAESLQHLEKCYMENLECQIRKEAQLISKEKELLEKEIELSIKEKVLQAKKATLLANELYLKERGQHFDRVMKGYNIVVKPKLTDGGGFEFEIIPNQSPVNLQDSILSDSIGFNPQQANPGDPEEWQYILPGNLWEEESKTNGDN